MHRRVVGRARAQAGDQLLDLELEHAGHELGGVAQQLVDAARGHGGVEAALLDGRAEHVARRRCAARGSRPASARRARSGPAPAAVAQPQRLALDRPHGHARRLGHRLEHARPRRRRRRRPARRPRARRRRSLTASPGSMATTSARARSTAPARSAARASAATVSRGSTAWSSGTSSARRTVGASAAPSRRACDGRSRSARSPKRRAQLELTLERLGLVAVTRDEQRAVGAQVDARSRWPPRARRRTAASGGRCRSPRRSSACSPASASLTGASIPADTRDVAAPSSPRSSTHVRSPPRWARQATARPMRPPPTTATSKALGSVRGSCRSSLRRHDPDQLFDGRRP